MGAAKRADRLAGRRRKVDDPPPTSLLHDRQNGTGEQVRSLHVHVDDEVPLLLFHIRERGREQDTGVVDEDADRSKRIHGQPHDGVHVCLDGHVSRSGQRAAAERVRHCPGGVAVLVVDDDLGVALDEPLRHCTAHTLPTASDDRNLA